jgi:MIP family channel proteins
MRSISEHAYSEFLGTFALVFVGSGAIMTASAPNVGGGLLEVALAHGLVLAIFVSAFMPIAAHFNPAVTIGFLFTRRITPKYAGVHIVAQLAGAIIAAYALKGLYPEALFDATNGGGQSVSSEISGLQPWIFEAIATFFLMTAIYATAVDKRSPNIGGFGIGLTLTVAILVIGPLTGGSLNPARSLGPALASGVLEALGIYLIAPVIGAVAAALAYEHLILRSSASPPPSAG